MPEEEEQEEIAVVDRVYEIAGVKRGETLPCQSSIGGYTIIYYSKRADPFCGKCASKHTDDCDPISYAGSYDEGPDLECSECGDKIESSYGDPEEEEGEKAVQWCDHSCSYCKEHGPMHHFAPPSQESWNVVRDGERKLFFPPSLEKKHKLIGKLLQSSSLGPCRHYQTLLGY